MPTVLSCMTLFKEPGRVYDEDAHQAVPMPKGPQVREGRGEE